MKKIILANRKIGRCETCPHFVVIDHNLDIPVGHCFYHSYLIDPIKAFADNYCDLHPNNTSLNYNNLETLANIHA